MYQPNGRSKFTGKNNEISSSWENKNAFQIRETVLCVRMFLYQFQVDFVTWKGSFTSFFLFLFLGKRKKKMDLNGQIIIVKELSWKANTINEIGQVDVVPGVNRSAEKQHVVWTGYNDGLFVVLPDTCGQKITTRLVDRRLLTVWKRIKR